MFKIGVRSSKTIVILLLALLFLVGCSSKEVSIGVNALASDPMAFKGEISVKGVVQQVDEENFSLILIDEEEYKTCGLFPCAGAGMLPLYLPDASKPMGPTPTNYTYKGDLPKVEETVTASGKIQVLENGQLFFEVEEVLKGSKALVKRN